MPESDQQADRRPAPIAEGTEAEVYRKTSSFADAVEVARAARDIFEEVGNERMAAKIDCTIAACYVMNGLFGDARVLYHNAVEIFEKSEDTAMQHICFLGLGYIRLLEESQKPGANFKEVLPVFVDIDASRPESYELYQIVTEELALAEALRLSGYSSSSSSRTLLI